jgi:hypothetical protein
MQMQEVVNQVLQMLEQTDEEEYNSLIALAQLNQALREVCEENEFGIMNRITSFTLSTPEEGEEPSYWLDVPGRAPITTALATTWWEFGYIKHAMLSNDGEQEKFPSRDIRELLDEYGDSYGTPQKFAVDGEYLYWRPIAAAGDDGAVARFLWSALPNSFSQGDEPALLNIAPFYALYRTCMLGALWTMDDNRANAFGALARDAFEKINMRLTMANDGPREAAYYNG